MEYTKGERFATPEPLGPGGDPYPAMFGSLMLSYWIKWLQIQLITGENVKNK